MDEVIIAEYDPSACSFEQEATRLRQILAQKPYALNTLAVQQYQVSQARH